MVKLLFPIFLIYLLSLESCTFQRMFYYPDTKNTEIKIKDFPVEEIYLKSKNGKKINCLFIKPITTPIASILFLHGNAGNISSWKKSCDILAKNGFQIFIIDYQGFGKSEGDVKHKNLFEDAETALLSMKNRPDVKNTKLIVMGMSIGGHLSVALTNKHQDKIDAMVIEGAFTTHNEIAVAIMPLLLKPFVKMLVISKYKAKKNISGIKIPKLIIYSTEDKTVPWTMGKKLFDKAVEPKQYWQINSKHVHGLPDYETEYIDRIKQLINL